MDTSKTTRRTNRGGVSDSSILRRQLALLRELLTSYGPAWYTEEMDKRLCETLAIPGFTRNLAASKKLL